MSRILILIGLFFVSCFFLFWNPFWSITESKKENVQAQNQPDFIANGMSLKRFDDSGYLSSLVKADEMEYYNDNLTKFTKPSYIIYPKKGKPRWKINADSGTFDQQNNVTLSSNVVISAIDPNESLQKLYTSYLEIDLKHMKVSSDKVIKIEGMQYNATGTGLKADLTLRTFELIENIQATYETIEP